MSGEGKTFISCKEIQERCLTWVESQKGVAYSIENNSIPLKRQLENSENSENPFATDSEFDSISECGGKKRRVGKPVNKEILHLNCQWKDCSFKTQKMTIFVEHVANHIPQLDIKMNDDHLNFYICKWEHCTFESDIPNIITRHVNYHSYHTKLKCIGTNIRERVKLPKCTREPWYKNDVSTPYLCNWDDCSKIFSNYQFYLYHVIAHTSEIPTGNKLEENIDCKWIGCKKQYPNIHRLRDHLKCHTKEKAIACPDCGATFASNTKFFVHCKRQIPLDEQGFQCSHCKKFYPTENILRDHMRLHVCYYKCHFCDMSCESPSSLAKHIRYRHISSRPFPCQLCSHAAKSQQDLDTHMSVHTEGPNFSCSVEGCQYKCKGAYSFDRHMERAHFMEDRWYCCHECPIKYRKSYKLTRHLIDAHQLQWPSGHTRFQYTQDEDGFYRLQTVRWESVDEEHPQEKQPLPKTDKKYKFKLNWSQPITRVEVDKILEDDMEDYSENIEYPENTEYPDNIEYSENTEDPLQTNDDIYDNIKSMPIIPNILISIDEMDADGNIIESKIVETQETKELPPSKEPPIILI